MAGEIRWGYTQTGLTDLFAVISNPAATQRWNGTAFENYNPANWAAYLRPLSENPVGGFEYVGTFPAAITTVAAYPIQFYRGSALGPAEASGVYYGSGAVEYSAEEFAAIQTRGELVTIPAIQAMRQGMIGFYQGDTLAEPLADLGNLTGYTKLWFTVKRLTDALDTAAVVQIEVAAGLRYLNGEAATAGQGSITNINAAAGEATIGLLPAATILLEPDKYLYDVVVLTASGRRTCGQGVFHVWPSITRAVA